MKIEKHGYGRAVWHLTMSKVRFCISAQWVRFVKDGCI